MQKKGGSPTRIVIEVPMKFCFYLFAFSLFADAQPDTFSKFPNKVFVETGSSWGIGIDMALNAGFKTIYSIEFSKDLFNHCAKRFESRPEVILFWGDSGPLLYDIIKEIDEPITFWLDAHTAENGPEWPKHSPIMEELEAIKRHPIKTHTILIDDVRLFGTELFDYVILPEITNKILEINPDYEISYTAGYQPNDVLVAKIKGSGY